MTKILNNLVLPSILYCSGHRDSKKSFDAIKGVNHHLFQCRIPPITVRATSLLWLTARSEARIKPNLKASETQWENSENINYKGFTK
jgi:hypothetical protein